MTLWKETLKYFIVNYIFFFSSGNEIVLSFACNFLFCEFKLCVVALLTYRNV